MSLDKHLNQLVDKLVLKGECKKNLDQRMVLNMALWSSRQNQMTNQSI